MNPNDIYKNIYKIVSEGYKDKQSFLSEEGFLLEVDKDNKYINVGEMCSLDNVSFFLLSYRNLLGRFPSEKTYKVWEEQFGLPKEEFQKKLFNTITNSLEYKIRNPKIYNLSLLRQSKAKENIASKVAPKLSGMYQKVRYMTLPDGLKQTIKKLVRW